jgi:uncharacterized protein (DUF169 family)
MPIKIAFRAAPPPGVERWAGGPVPAGCVFWARAMEGKTFYTLPEDHYNCAVGCHTHNISLPPDRAGELPATIGFMVETRYLDPAEVAGIPTLKTPPAVVAYAPATSAAFEPDVVLVAVSPSQAKVVFEGALKAGVAQTNTAVLSRPSCGILPVSTASGPMALSLGCQGNRTFTWLPDDEMYLSLPGSQWEQILDCLVEAQRSNLTMANYYQAHKAKIGDGTGGKADDKIGGAR